MTNNRLVSVQNVSKDFTEGEKQFRVLSEVSFDIQAGDFTALCGPSGSGKTTLLNLIGCLDQPSEGRIILDGKPMNTCSQKQLAQIRLQEIGFIFQDYNLIPTFTAIENVEYVLWLQKVAKTERRTRAEYLLEKFGLKHLINRRPSQMSRGQQQRVAVARALVHKPKIVLGDELTANLDSKTGEALMDFLRQLNEEEQMTFIYASHDAAMLKRAKHLVELKDGVVLRSEAVSVNTPREI